MIWVSWPKKASRVPTDITEDVIRELALPLHLVDVKVCAVDDIWSALKLVIRRDHRALEGHQVDDLTEGITDLVHPVVEAEDAHLAAQLLGIVDSRERQDRFAQLDAKLASAFADRILCDDFLDAVDDAQA